MPRKPTLVERRISELKAGDRTPWYTIVSKPEIHGGEYYVRVQYHVDGGEQVRRWGDGNHKIPVEAEPFDA